MSEVGDEWWWGVPDDARRSHIFEEKGWSRSLCGKWMLGHLESDPDVTEDDEYKPGEDCKACCREAGLLGEEGDG